MLLTALTIIFFIVSYKLNKEGKQIKYFLPYTVFLLGMYLLAIIPMNFVFGWLLGILISVYVWAMIIDFNVIKIQSLSQKSTRVLLFGLLVISIYTQLFNGIETFAHNPGKYFQYSKDIIYKYYFVPPKIISKMKEEKDYVYSLVQFKNSYFMPESMTRIDIYEGRACYYKSSWHFGALPTFYKKYFHDNSNIDYP